MQVLERPWGAMHYRAEGPQDAPAVVFANSLGTDLRLWDALLPLLPSGLRMVRYDKAGHGLSQRGAGGGMAALAEDAAALITHATRGPVVFVGLSIGGLIGQRLAATHPGMLAGLVLSNTAARMGTQDSWRARIKAIQDGGLEAIAPAVMERWFAPAFLARPERALWQRMLECTDPQGYRDACLALAEADETETTKGLTLPVQVIAGSADGASPPDLVAATAQLIGGAAYHLLPGVGHLPPVEDPKAMAAVLGPFLRRVIGH